MVLNWKKNEDGNNQIRKELLEMEKNRERRDI